MCSNKNIVPIAHLVCVITTYVAKMCGSREKGLNVHAYINTAADARAVTQFGGRSYSGHRPKNAPVGNGTLPPRARTSRARGASQHAPIANYQIRKETRIIIIMIGTRILYISYSV